MDRSADRHCFKTEGLDVPKTGRGIMVNKAAFYNMYEKVCENKYFGRFLTPELVGQLVRYCVTGVSSATLEFLLLLIGKDALKLQVITSNSIALSIVFWFNFLMNRKWSFKSTADLKKQLSRYLVLFIFNLTASDFIMYLLVTKLAMYYLFAKLFAIGAITLWNFFMYKKVIYR